MIWADWADSVRFEVWTNIVCIPAVPTDQRRLKPSAQPAVAVASVRPPSEASRSSPGSPPGSGTQPHTPRGKRRRAYCCRTLASSTRTSLSLSLAMIDRMNSSSLSLVSRISASLRPCCLKSPALGLPSPVLISSSKSLLYVMLFLLINQPWCHADPAPHRRKREGSQWLGPSLRLGVLDLRRSPLRTLEVSTDLRMMTTWERLVRSMGTLVMVMVMDTESGKSDW